MRAARPVSFWQWKSCCGANRASRFAHRLIREVRPVRRPIRPWLRVPRRRRPAAARPPSGGITTRCSSAVPALTGRYRLPWRKEGPGLLEPAQTDGGTPISSGKAGPGREHQIPAARKPSSHVFCPRQSPPLFVDTPRCGGAYSRKHGSRLHHRVTAG